MSWIRTVSRHGRNPDRHRPTRVQRLFLALKRELGNDLIIVYRVPGANTFVCMSSNVPNQTAAILRSLGVHMPPFPGLDELDGPR